jgi:hypothetical protein
MVTGSYGDDRTRFDGQFFLKNGERERRSGFERRRFRYDVHIPERRGPADRRNGKGRESRVSVAAIR